MLHTISPIDGRYAGKTKELRPYFSEAALIRYRCHVEIEYLIALSETGIITRQKLSPQAITNLRMIVSSFSDEDALEVKTIESRVNHDVKAIEYFIRGKLEKQNLGALLEWVHFGLTSQDINNSAFPLMIRNAYREEIIPGIKSTIQTIYDFANVTKAIPMLAFTHGQPASPTLLGKEMMVFIERLDIQLKHLESLELKVKFSGATGNFNAHAVAFPGINWKEWADTFTNNYLHIDRYQYTTQIEHYDQIAALCHATMRINTILIDFCRDIWSYISMRYLTQKSNPDEVGSSAMPHKVNPIDFENAEGNFGLANAILGHLADKLPVSRLQRDLTDSTVLRNIGVPVAHTLLGLKSVQKGLGQLSANESRIQDDLNDNWAVLAEAIQTVLRREGVAHPYELLKDLTRGKGQLTRENLHAFIQQLHIRDEVKEELRKLTPSGYTGVRFDL